MSYQVSFVYHQDRDGICHGDSDHLSPWSGPRSPGVVSCLDRAEDGHNLASVLFDLKKNTNGSVIAVDDEGKQ